MAEGTAGTTVDTVRRTQQAKGGYDVYEQVQVTNVELIRQVLDLNSTEIPPGVDAGVEAVTMYVLVGTYKGDGPTGACWKAVEDRDAPLGLHARAQGKTPPILAAGTTGRGGLSGPKPYGLDPTPVFKRRQ